MTLSASSNKINPALNLFGFTVRKSMGFTALASVLVLIISPFYIITVINDYCDRTGEVYDLSYILPQTVSFLAVAACIFFVVLLMINFYYLYNKSASDTFHSVPVTRNELIISRFGASYVCSVILLAVGYLGLIGVAAMKNVEADISVILVSFAYSAFMMLFCGAFVLITVISAGTVFDSIVSFLCLNIGFPIIAALVYNLCESNLYGFASSSYATVVCYSSPYLFSLYTLLAYLSGDRAMPISVIGILAVIVLIVAFLIISFRLYNRRKSEMTGTAYAFKYMPAVIGFVVSFICYFVLASLFQGDAFEENWFAGAIGAVLGGAIYNIITNRGFKKVKVSILISAVSLAAILCVTVSIKADIFGYGKYIPQSDSVRYATVMYQGAQLDVTDPAAAVNLQKEIVRSNYEGLSENYEDMLYEYIRFDYTLKNGRSVSRSYNIPASVATKEKTVLINNYLPDGILNSFNEFKGTEFYLCGWVPENEENIRVAVTRSEVSALLDAYIKDVRKTVITEDWNSEINGEFYIDGNKTETNTDEYGKIIVTNRESYYQSIRIHSDYNNTLEFINSLNLESRTNLEDNEKQ